MKILVTGAAGFIGSNLLKELKLSRYKVIAIDNFDPYYDPSIKIKNLNRLGIKINPLEGIDEYNDVNISFYNKDCSDLLTWDLSDIDIIIHLAATPGVRYSIDNPLSSIKNNYYLSSLVFQCAIKYKIPIIYASSSSVYGDLGNRKDLNELDLELFPRSPYALSKLQIEQLAQYYHKFYGLNSIGLRFFTVYGPNNRPDMAIYKFIDNIYNERRLKVYNRGNSCRDFTYVGDVIEAILRLIDYPINGSQIYNIGTANTYPILYIVSLLANKLGKVAEVEKTDYIYGDAVRTKANINKIKSIINWEPKVSISEGLDKTIDWYKSIQ